MEIQSVAERENTRDDNGVATEIYLFLKEREDIDENP